MEQVKEFCYCTPNALWEIKTSQGEIRVTADIKAVGTCRDMRGVIELLDSLQPDWQSLVDSHYGHGLLSGFLPSPAARFPVAMQSGGETSPSPEWIAGTEVWAVKDVIKWLRNMKPKADTPITVEAR